MKYTEEDTQEIFWGDHPDLEEEVASWIDGTRRWGHDETKVFKHNKNGEHWAVSMYIMSGDGGDHLVNGAPWRVEPKEEKKIVWVPVEGKYNGNP